MWQRFSENARKAVFYAQEEAQRFGEGYVSTEHLLLGLMRDRNNNASRVLEHCGMSIENIRSEVERHLPRGKFEPKNMTLTPRAKRVIDLAYSNARLLGHKYIGTEHLLLGLVDEGDGLAGRILEKYGAELSSLRKYVEDHFTRDGTPVDEDQTSPGIMWSAGGLTGLLGRKDGQSGVLLLMCLKESEALQHCLVEHGHDPLSVAQNIQRRIFSTHDSGEGPVVPLKEVLREALRLSGSTTQGELDPGYLFFAGLRLNEDMAKASGLNVEGALSRWQNGNSADG